MSKFSGLLEKGRDVRILCGQSDKKEWENFLGLKKCKDIRKRVHVSWRTRPRWLAVILLPVVLIRCLIHNPHGTWQYLLKGWKRWRWGVFRRLYLDAELIVLRPNLIHFEFGAIAANRMYLKELLNTNIVVSFRGYDINYIGLDDPDYYRDIWVHADAIHLLGDNLWRRAQKRGCPSEKPHRLIPPAIDTDFFNPGERLHRNVAGTPDRPLRILSVGRLKWEKGYEYALQAVRFLIDLGISCDYRIVGNGNYLEMIAFIRYQLGLEKVIQLLGALSPAEVRNQMLWADVFLHSAVSEGFCNAVLEAQAMKLPVVCTDADGLPENAANGETGFVVPRRNPEALADKLALLARDPAMRQRMGEAGRRRVMKMFRLEDQIIAFDQFYREVLGRKTEKLDESVVIKENTDADKIAI